MRKARSGERDRDENSFGELSLRAPAPFQAETPSFTSGARAQLIRRNPPISEFPFELCGLRRRRPISRLVTQLAGDDKSVIESIDEA